MIKLSDLQKIGNKKALEKFISSHYKSSTDLFLADLDKTISGLLFQDIKLMGEYVIKLDGIFKLLPKEFMPRLYAIKGRYTHRKGESRVAVRNYSRAIDIYEKMRNWEAVAKTRRGLMDVYMYLGRYDDAIKTGKLALQYFRKKKMLHQAAQVMVNLGNVYHRMDNNRVALYYYDKAREVYLKEGGIVLAVIEFNRANIYANINNLQKAEQLYKKAGEFYRKNNYKISEAQAKYSIAYLYFLQDRYTEAMKLFEELYSTFESLGAKKEATVTLLDMAEIDIQLSQFSSAASIADKIIPEFKKLGMSYEESKAHYFAADARIRLGDLKSASRFLDLAKNQFKKEKNNLWLGMVNIARGKLNTALEKYDEAARAASQAISLFNKSGNKRRKIDAELALLGAEAMAGNTVKAFKISDSLEHRNLVGYQKYNLNYLVGCCHYKLGDYGKALRRFRDAVEIVETMLAGFYSDEIRFFFAIDKLECYRMVVECLLRLQNVDASFLANLHALQAINHKTDYGLRQKTKIPSELIDKRNRLRAALKKLNQVSIGGQREIADTHAYSTLEHQLWSNERKIRSILYPRNLERRKGRMELRDLRQEIRPDELVINFFSSNDRIGAFLADSEKVNFIEFDTSAKILDSYLRKLHFIFESAVCGLKNDENGQIAQTYLGHIYDALFQKLVPAIKGKKLILIADADFAQIPFNALRDKQGRLLIDSHEIRIIINPNDMRSRSTSKKNFENMRNAVFAVSSDSLPLTDAEARQIKNTFTGSQIYINEDASSNNLLKEIRKTEGFIHIAAHASRASENPLFSRILLGDGPFFPFDLFESGIRANLAILSGCQTAAPGLYYGNSFSLAKAFFQAGARHVLATLWPVSDRVSVLFMSQFYKSLKEKNNIYLSFLDAVNEIKGLTDNPAYWSSFILLGI
jgi:CHAT domain-containing protein